VALFSRRCRSLAVRVTTPTTRRSPRGTHEVPTPEDAARVRVSLSLWSESESFNLLRHAVARLGPEPPETKQAFPDAGQNTSALPDGPYDGLREPLHLAEGWREYSFEWNVPADVAQLFVSAGVSVVWETDATHFVDDVRVEFTSRWRRHA
jgi:hypothetical protein